MTHLVTLTGDGTLSSKTTLASVSQELTSIWTQAHAISQRHCDARNTTVRRDLAGAIQHVTAYGNSRLAEVHVHCKSTETSHVNDGKRRVDEKTGWVNSKLATKMKKP